MTDNPFHEAGCSRMNLGAHHVCDDGAENDAPMNLCGFCGMRTTAPGLTACSDCA